MRPLEVIMNALDVGLDIATENTLFMKLTNDELLREEFAAVDRIIIDDRTFYVTVVEIQELRSPT